MALQDLLDAVDERVGHRKLISTLLDEPLPGGASWAFVFGSAAVILFLVQVGTGLVLATYYSASATDAWASVAYIERAVSMGGVVRGIHHHAAGGMVIIVGLHLIQVVLYGAYRRPREANWLAGLGLLGLVLAFALTGYLLPWDQTGYWATKVATGIAGTVPIVGEPTQRFLQGGNDYGNLTLTRFYALHVVLLPLLTFGLIGGHMALFRRHGVTPKHGLTDKQLERRKDSFWPRQVAYDAVFATTVVGLVIAAGAILGAPLQAPADPASNFIARPEWYFLFLFQLLKYFDGPMQIVGTTILPGAIVMFLVAMPFLDRGASRSIADRKGLLAVFTAGVLAVVALTVIAKVQDSRDPTLAAQNQSANDAAARAIQLAAAGVPAEGAAFMMQNDPLTRGERIFRGECMSCHPFEGQAPDEVKGPELTGYRTEAWARQVLRDPDSRRLFGLTKLEGMPSFAELDDRVLDGLVSMVVERRDTSAPNPEEGPLGEVIEEHECGNCHDFEEASGLDGPAMFGYQSSEWVAAVIADGSADHLYGELSTMPAYRERLSDTDRAAVTTFVLSIESRPKVEGWPYVDDAGPVPTPRATETSTAP